MEGNTDHRSRDTLAAAGSLLIALLLRLWGIGFSPTAPRARPDEEIFTTKGLDYFNADHGLDSQILGAGWPEGFFRIVHGLQWLQATALHVLWHQPVNLACLYAVNPGAVQIWPRVFSALIDTAGCLLVGLTVRRLAREDERAVAMPLGILALGCNYLAIRDAHFGVTDATLLFTICLCVYASVRAAMDGPRFLPLVALGAGAGFGVKYAAAPMAVLCLVAFAVCLQRFKHTRRRTFVFGLLSVATGVLVFHLASPNALGHFHMFWDGLLGHGSRYGGDARFYLVDPGFDVPPGWKFYLLEGLPTAFGWPGFVMSVAGLILCLRRDRHTGVVLIASALAAFAMLVTLQALFVRYGAPVIPPLTVGLGVLLTTAFGWLRSRPFRGFRVAVAIALVLVALAPPLRLAVQLDRLLSAPDTRDLATQWLLRQGPDSPAVTQGWYAHVRLLEPESVQACRAVVPPFLWREVPVLPSAPSNWQDLVEADEIGWGAIGHSAIDQFTGDTPGRERARFVVDAEGTLPCGREGRNEEYPPLELPCFELVAEIDPGMSVCSGFMDVYDAMWIPYRGFEGQRFPGPRIKVYENYCRKE